MRLPVVFCCLILVFSPTYADAASCFSGTQGVPADKLAAEKAAINANAAQWLSGKGGNLASAIRDIAASDPDFAASIVPLVKGATREQSSAVGAGLGQAATACKSLPNEAAKIQAAVAASTDALLLASYSSATGNTQTASTGGGGGGDGGGAGTGIGGSIGGTTSSTGSGSGSPVSTPTSTSNAFQNLLTGGSGSSASSIGAGSTTTTTIVQGATSVSAF